MKQVIYISLFIISSCLLAQENSKPWKEESFTIESYRYHTTLKTTYPNKWHALVLDEQVLISPKKFTKDSIKKMDKIPNCFLALPIDKQDAGPEQLLNKKDGLLKWATKILPDVTKSKEKIVFQKDKKGFIHTVVKKRYYTLALKPQGNINLVLICQGPEAEKKDHITSFLQMIDRISVTKTVAKDKN